MASPAVSGIDLYWLPLGAGGHSVRLNGKVFEAVAANLGHRDRCDLYHSALQVHTPEGRYVIEQAPAWNDGAERGVVAEGPVGTRAAGRFRLFRYEVRRWRDGVIPDLGEAVESPRRLSNDPDCARRLLELVPEAPTPVWGRDELRAGEMWNSNSLISWLIARCGLAVQPVHPPPADELQGGGPASSSHPVSRLEVVSRGSLRGLRPGRSGLRVPRHERCSRRSSCHRGPSSPPAVLRMRTGRSNPKLPSRTRGAGALSRARRAPMRRAS